MRLVLRGRGSVCVGVVLSWAGMVAADAVEHANKWVGIWAAEPAWCAFADQVGSHKPAPISLNLESVDGYENSCAVTGVAQVGEMRAWRLGLLCQAEGSEYAEETLVLLESDDVLWRYWWDGEPVRFTRCGT